MRGPNKADRRRVEALINSYTMSQDLVRQFQSALVTAISTSRELAPLVHSVRSRLKDPEHLRNKLYRQISRCKLAHMPFDVAPDNLLTRISDLAGIRILHLYTRQISSIDKALRTILDEQRFALVEGPFARTWDDESRAFLESCGIETQDSPSLYTSVHYVVSSASRTTVTCEIQVRTLMEEVWGEVDHAMNYPHESESLACREQIKVLARVTSSATRLVDSIFLTLEDHHVRAAKRKAFASIRGPTNDSASRLQSPTRKPRKPSPSRRR
jgi:ppGpp synthetase/RelA/SpoT-type nucleotidyltranferase